MGWRYRKSLNLGKHFRINFSKSGIGYSYGIKGYRVSKTAKGTTRRTATMPFGISHVTETKSKNGKNKPQVVPWKKAKKQAIWMLVLAILFFAAAVQYRDRMFVEGLALGLLFGALSISNFAKSNKLKGVSSEETESEK